MIILVIMIVGILLYNLRSIFEQWSDMDYVKKLEDMGEFTDREGKEKC